MPLLPPGTSGLFLPVYPYSSLVVIRLLFIASARAFWSDPLLFESGRDHFIAILPIS